MRTVRVLVNARLGAALAALLVLAHPGMLSAVDPLKLPPRPVAILMLSAVAVNPATVTGGTQVGGTVTLTRPAPAGGATVTLQSSNPGVAAVPLGGVVVQPGATSSTFVVLTKPAV